MAILSLAVTLLASTLANPGAKGAIVASLFTENTKCHNQPDLVFFESLGNQINNGMATCVNGVPTTDLVSFKIATLSLGLDNSQQMCQDMTPSNFASTSIGLQALELACTTATSLTLPSGTYVVLANRYGMNAANYSLTAIRSNKCHSNDGKTSFRFMRQGPEIRYSLFPNNSVCAEHANVVTQDITSPNSDVFLSSLDTGSRWEGGVETNPFLVLNNKANEFSGVNPLDSQLLMRSFCARGGSAAISSSTVADTSIKEDNAALHVSAACGWSLALLLSVSAFLL